MTKKKHLIYSTEKTDTSYALLFTFSLSNISMPESADFRNNTYAQVQNSINKAVSLHFPLSYSTES